MITRRVVEFTGSKMVVIPAQFCNQLGIEKGTVMSVECKTDKNEITITPVEEK